MPHIARTTASYAGAESSMPPGIVWMPPDTPTPPPPDVDGDPPRGRANQADTEPGRLLWIDDQIRPEDAVVRLLEMERFRVDCAGSGATGLAMAQRTPYVGIILDLRLPDISGLTVLETLTRRHVPAPILVLTGYPDFEAAVQAMRLGAWDCQSKTVLLGDKWLGLVRALAERGGTMRSPSTGLLSAHGGLLNEWLESLKLFDRRAIPGESGDRPDLEQLRIRVLQTLADRRLNVFLFLVFARVLNLTRGARAHTLPAALREIEHLVEEATARDSVTPDWRVQATLSTLAAADTRIGQFREEEIARTLGVHRAHLGRLLRDATGFNFKQWRWGFLLRPALAPLATTQEHVAQIAYGCGYGSSAQFDRDFRRLLHITPTEYRQLIQKHVRSVLEH